MRKSTRIILFLFSLIVSLTALLFIWQILDPSVTRGINLWLIRLAESEMARNISLTVCVVVVMIGIAMMTLSLIGGRLRKSRIRVNETGTIDVGIGAIESIALNSATLANVGVKSAKARVAAGKQNQIRLVMIVELYSDVEIQAQMASLQDRVKKDVERYTGIPVETVEVKVNRIELIGAQIEN